MLALFKDWNPRFPGPGLTHLTAHGCSHVRSSNTDTPLKFSPFTLIDLISDPFHDLPQTTIATGLSVITKEEIGNSRQRSMPQASLSKARYFSDYL